MIKIMKIMTKMIKKIAMMMKIIEVPEYPAIIFQLPRPITASAKTLRDQ